MAWSQSFLPCVTEDTRLLILGSMPGVKSLEEQQYYAHARNLFWPFMNVLFNVDPNLPYAERVLALNAQGVGLWDVYSRCFRRGSLDSAIDKSSVQVNAFDRLLSDYPSIEVIAMNGQAASKAFSRHVVSDTEKNRFLSGKKWLSLPSTSPANAAMNYDEKLAAWQRLKDIF